MASGTLGQSAPSATTNTTVYTVPTGKIASFIVSFCNRSASSGTVRLAIAASGSPSSAEWIEFDTTVNANSVLERSGIVATAGKNIVVYCSSANFSVNVYGYEE